MKPLVVIGVILAVLGIVAFAIPTFTYFTTEPVADVGFFRVDVSQPHTIVVNPMAGLIALVVGTVMILTGSRR
jgi:uncharacterized membrane protein HdeD (DUF308 family)